MTNRPLVFVIVGCMLIASCSPRYTSTPTPSAPRSAWLAKFLHNPTCQPPCWENITPGKSTITEAKRILFASSDIEVTFEDSEGIDWKFLPNYEVGKAESFKDNYGLKIVDYLNFGLIGRQTLRLSEIVDAYGQPNFITISRDIHYRDKCYVCIAFQSFDIVLGTYQKCSVSDIGNGGESIQLTIFSDTLIEYLSLTSKGVKAYTRVNEFPNKMIIWKGYGEYGEVHNP